jgi:hypothetical protein
LVTVLAGYFRNNRVINMPIPNPLPIAITPQQRRHRQRANGHRHPSQPPRHPRVRRPAHPRFRDLLETLHCLCFRHGDVQDIPHITHALYLLAQDGNDLLQVAQQQMLDWKAPV